MELVLEIVTLGRAARNTANIKNRQPVGQMFVKAPFILNDFYKAIVADELILKPLNLKMIWKNIYPIVLSRSLKFLGPRPVGRLMK